MAIEISYCPDCGGMPKKDYDRAEIICERCGFVIADKIIDGRPDVNYGDNESKTHAGAVDPTRADGGLGNTLTNSKTDAYKKRIASNRASYFMRLAKTNRRYMMEKGAKRSLATALKDIDNLCTHMELPETIRVRMCDTYKRFSKKDGLRGRSVKVTCAAIAYAECRRAGVARSLDEIGKVAGINKRELGRAYRFVAKTMRFRIETTNPVEYLQRFGANLGLSITTIGCARELLNGAVDNFVGKSPVSLAAAAIYTASDMCGEHRTQSRISEVSGVTEVTIRKICRAMAAKASEKEKAESEKTAA